MVSAKTLNIIGDKTINRCCTSNSETCFAASVTISAGGNKLTLCTIFKSISNGKISQMVFPANPKSDRVVLCCQKKAQKDESNMQNYIN
jgi:hypothetical protein